MKSAILEIRFQMRSHLRKGVVIGFTVCKLQGDGFELQMDGNQMDSIRMVWIHWSSCSRFELERYHALPKRLEFEKNLIKFNSLISS